MVMNNNMTTKVAKLLANESIDTDWNVALGDDNTTTASPSNTDMDSELGRETAIFATNGNTMKISIPFSGFDVTYDGETIKETAVFDSNSSGNLEYRDTDFTPFVIDGDTVYETVVFGEVSQDNNTTGTKLTDIGVTNILDGLAGNITDYPTHIGFSTRLIFDTFNVTTGWTASGGAIATSTNKQEGTASLDLTKTSGSTVVSITKTLGTAVDASDVTKIRQWVRINTLTTLNKLTTSNCFEIRIGNDSSNYKSITLDRSDLTTVWKLLDLNLTDFSDTGSPDMSDIDYLYLGFTTNNTTDTWTTGELLLDFLSGDSPIDESDTVLHEEVVRKIISTTSRDEVAVRYDGVLTTSEGNTYNYYYLGLFDDATSGDMFIVNALLLTEKDDGKQINFVVELGVQLI